MAKKPSPESVEAVQKLLKEQGFYKGDISGVKNWATESAIREYQVKNKLKNTGEIDDVLADLVSKPALAKPSAQPSVKPAIPPSQTTNTTQGAPAAPAAAKEKKPSDYKGLSKEEAIRQFKRDANAYKKSFGDTPAAKRRIRAEEKLSKKGVDYKAFVLLGEKHQEALKSRDPDIAEMAKASVAWHDSIPENADNNALKEAHGVTDKEIRRLRFEAEEPDFTDDAPGVAPAAAPQNDTPLANPVEGVIAPTPKRNGGGVQVPADAPGVADIIAGIRGIAKPEMDAAAAADQAALVDAARNQGFDQGKKWVQDAADQKKAAAAGRNPPVFLSAQQLARYNNSVKWAEAGMSPGQIAEKHAKTTYSQPGNVAADTSGLPATFLEDNNFTLTPPAQKGAMGGMSTEGQWNKLFPNRAGTPDMPNAGAKAPAEPIKPGAQLMGAVMAGWASGWEGTPNENPDDLRARRADLFRQQMAADLAPGWHEPQTGDLIGSTFTQDGDTRSFTAPAFGGSGFATNVPKLPSAPPSADQPVADGLSQKDAKGKN